MINANLPNNFSFQLGSVAGSEEAYLLKPGAIKFYSSIHNDGSVIPDLIGIAYGQGRVA